MITAEDFQPHKLNLDQLHKIKQIEKIFIELGEKLNVIITDSREKDIVRIKLQEAKMWATRSIAIK